MPGVNLNLQLPSGADNMATVVSKTAAALSAIQNDLAPKVTAGELNINASLPFNGNAATGLGSVQLASGNTPTAAGSIYYFNGEFYAIDSTGVVQLTSAGSINASGIGGIVGDYGGVNPARVTYVAATGTYQFTVSTGVWALLAALGIVLEGTNGTTKLTCDASVNTNQTVPFGLINSTDLLVWDGSKIKPAGNSVAYGSGLKLGGDVSYSNSHFSTSLEVQVPFIGAGDTSYVTGGSVGLESFTGGGSAWSYRTKALPVRSGDRILAISVHFTSYSTGTKSIEVHKTNSANGSDTIIQSFTTTTTVPGDFVAVITPPGTVVASGDKWYFKIFGPGSDVFTNISFTYDRP